MEDFNPDDYLAKKNTSTNNDFDPDAYLSKRAPKKEEEPGILSQGLNALDYPRRVLSTSAVAAMSPGVTFEDVKDVASEPFSPSKKSQLLSSGKMLRQALGSSSTPVEDRNIVKIPGTDAAYDVTGLKEDVLNLGTELLTDPTSLIPFKSIGGVLGAGAKATGEGLKSAAKTTGQAIKGAASEVAKGASELAPKAVGMFSKTGEDVTRAGIESFKRTGQEIARQSTPKISKYADKALEIAKKFDIPEDLIKRNDQLIYGEDSAIGNIYKATTQNPLAGNKKELHNAGLDAIQNAFSKRIEKIGGGIIPQSPKESGELLQNAYNDKIDEFFKGIDFTYKSSASQLPQGGRFGFSPKAAKTLDNKLTLISNEAAKVIRGVATPTKKQQASLTLEQINMIKQGLKSKRSFPEIIDYLQDSGKQIFKSKPLNANDIPLDKKLLGDVYFAISDAATDTVGDFVGKEAKKSLIENNKAIHEFLTDKDSLGNFISQDIAPEKIFEDVIAKADSKKLENAVKFFGKDNPALRAAKAGWIDDQIRLVKDGKMSMQQFLNKRRNDSRFRKVIDTLFENDEIKDIDDLLELNEKYGSYVMNPSGTGPYTQMRDIMKVPAELAGQEAMGSFLKSRAEIPNSPGVVPISIINQPVESVKKSSKIMTSAEPRSNYSQVLREEYPTKIGLQSFQATRRDSDSKSYKDTLSAYERTKNQYIPQNEAAKMWQEK